MQDLYSRWISKVPSPRHSEMVFTVPLSYRAVRSDDRLKVIFDRTVRYWTRSLSRVVPEIPGSDPTIQMFRLYTHLFTLTRECGDHPYEIFVIGKFKTLISKTKLTNPGMVAMGGNKFVDNDDFLEEFSDFLACRDHPSEFSEMVDCAYDTAIEAFQCGS